MRTEIKLALKDYEELGICITYLPGYIHAKVAIIDREILWEGSLNILSQRESKEMMRRTADEDSAMQIMSHLELNGKIAEGYKFQYERLCQSLIKNSEHRFKLKIKLFVTGFVIPIISWWLFFGLKVIIIFLKGVKLLMNLIKLVI